jgi:hydrogenase 3 maturation protease
LSDSSKQFDHIEHELRDWLKGAHRIVIIGIGNPFRRDDHIGMEIVKLLNRAALSNVRLIEAGQVPESYLDLVEDFHPSHVLMIDAAEMGLQPGSAKLVSSDEIVGFSLSTHTLPLSVLSEYVAKRTGARIVLLAIQPKLLDFGEGLSQELSGLVQRFSDIIVKALKLHR